MSNATIQGSGGGSGLLTNTSDSGTATVSSNNINIVGTGGITTSGATDTVTIDGSGIAPSFLDQSQIYYVSKAGDDSNDGLNQEVPFLTIGAAITAAAAQTPSSSNLFAIYVLDAGVYAEDITLQDYVSLWAPNATIDGTIEVDDNTTSKIGSIICSVSQDIAITKNTGSGQARIHVDYINTGGSIAVIGNGNGELFLTGNQFFGGTDGLTTVDSPFINNGATLSVVANEIEDDGGSYFLQTANTGTTSITCNQLLHNDELLNISGASIVNINADFLYMYGTTGGLGTFSGATHTVSLSGSYFLQDDNINVNTISNAKIAMNFTRIEAKFDLGNAADLYVSADYFESGPAGNNINMSSTSELTMDIGFFLSSGDFIVNAGGTCRLKVNKARLTGSTSDVITNSTGTSITYAEFNIIEMVSNSTSAIAFKLSDGITNISCNKLIGTANSKPWSITGGTHIGNFGEVDTTNAVGEFTYYNLNSKAITLRGLDGASGKECVQKQAEESTTDATVTDLIQIPIAEEEKVTIWGTFQATQDDNTDHHWGNFQAMFTRDTGGDVTLIDSMLLNDFASSSTAFLATADTGNQEAKITWTGINSENWNIIANYSYNIGTI